MEIMEDIVRYANGFVNYDLIKLWADESGDMINWLSDIIERDGKFKMWFEGSVGTEGQGARDKAWARATAPKSLSTIKRLRSAARCAITLSKTALRFATTPCL